MSHSVFHFRHFTVHQDRCAMKVGTDGVLLGAWTRTADAHRILDIGTGTGLIALMMAQKSDALIDAIEIDGEAATQAQENFEASTWNNRLRSIHDSVQHFATTSKDKYDLIVSNPPYFMGAHPAPVEARNVARHMDQNLKIEELAECAKNLLNPNGRFCIILPHLEGMRFIDYASTHGLFLSRLTRVRTKSGKTEKRLLMEFKPQPCHAEEDEILLQDEEGNYTAAYRKLTTEFYPGM
ncbi:MAG: tRNA1(Val) (adenine(37)-N6)-methyltransferase [Bacteroidota bacterium]